LTRAEDKLNGSEELLEAKSALTALSPEVLILPIIPNQSVLLVFGTFL
jgi:hypothetical protein